jgi:uncharacterized damage-inducible protein DinB
MGEPMRLLLIACACLGVGTGTDAPKAATVLASPLQMFHELNSKNIIDAARAMPEERYAYRPAAPPVRSFGQLVAHIADGNYVFCSAALGKPDPIHPGLQLPVEAVPEESLERRLRTKQEILEAVEASFGYCASAFEGLTDQSLAAPIAAFGTRAMVLTLAVYHAGQHYGNIVTTMRAAGVEPPTALSAPGRR